MQTPRGIQFVLMPLKTNINIFAIFQASWGLTTLIY